MALTFASGVLACASDPKSGTDPTLGGAAGASPTTTAGSAAAPTGPTTGGIAGSGLGAAGSSAAGTGTAGISGGAGSAAPGGAAGMPASGAAGSGTSSSPSGGYITMGEWQGYAFTSASGAGSTIMPMDFAMRQAGQPLCASGSVGPAEDYSGTALVGINVSQAMDSDVPMAIVPTKAGLFVQVKNNAGSTLRVQIQGPNGATDANDRWCAPLSGTSAFIPWSTFNTMCWDNSGMAYAQQPIVAAMVLVPGGMTEPVAFDFCIESLMPADAASGGAAGAGAMMPAAGSMAMPPGAAGSMAMSPGAGGSGAMVPAGSNSGSGMLTDKYGAAMVMRDGRSYYVQNNVWGDDASQVLVYEGTTFEITQQTGSTVASGPSAMGPVSYPSVFIGSNHNRATNGSNLPKQVSSLTSVRTGWSNNANSGISGVYNAAYDVWFSTGPGGDSGGPSGGYLMVWYWKPSGAQPIGSVMGAPVRIPGIDGEWEVWVGTNNGTPCISYVRTQPIESLDFDLNAFIQHAVNVPGGIQSSWYLTNVFAGFEIWSGGVGLETSAFYAIVE